MTPGSNVVTGTGTNWPFNDLVNTTVPTESNGNIQVGYTQVTPATMTNISVDQYLYVSDFEYSEVIQVTEVTPTTFTAQFQFLHNPGFSITASSVAGRQLQMGSNLPIYTLTAVTEADGMGNNLGLLDVPFGGPAVSGLSYSLVLAYVTIDPLIKDFIQVWDPLQGIPLPFHVTQGYLNATDPMRTSTGSPACLADLYPTPSGSMLYEIWPYQTVAYSIPVLYAQQWPEMKRPTDPSPWFINPTVISDGAIARALRRQELKNSADKDPYFNPQLSKEFQADYVRGLMAAASADEGKCLQAIQQNMRQSAVPGGSWWQSHAVSAGDRYFLGPGDFY
jgi:hypothetical protein